MQLKVQNLTYNNGDFRSLFTSIHDVKLEEAHGNGAFEPSDEVGFGHGSATGLRAGTPGSRAKTSSIMSDKTRSDTPPKIDKRLTQIYVSFNILHLTLVK